MLDSNQVTSQQSELYQTSISHPLLTSQHRLDQHHFSQQQQHPQLQHTLRAQRNDHIDCDQVGDSDDDDTVQTYSLLPVEGGEKGDVDERETATFIERTFSFEQSSTSPPRLDANTDAHPPPSSVQTTQNQTSPPFVLDDTTATTSALTAPPTTTSDSAQDTATTTTVTIPEEGKDMVPNIAVSSSTGGAGVAVDMPAADAHCENYGKHSGKIRSSASSTSLQLVSLVSTLPISHHALKTALWVVVALTVALGLALFVSKQHALEFLTAYIVEYSLSVDNLFVFLLIFRYFRVPGEAQQSVLSYGIVGAMLLRGLFIVCGTALVRRFQWIALLFAALLVYSAVKLLLEDDDDDASLDDNKIIRLSKSLMPVSDRYAGERFFVRENGGRLLATPLMVVLVSIELSDIIFALDSVPAVLALSSSTFVIYSSNMLAVMGLRSLFFVLSASLGNVRFLKQALAVVLGFIGAKMVAGFFGWDFGTVVSLIVVVVAIAGGVLLSILFPERGPGGGRATGGSGGGVEVGPPNQVAVTTV